MATPWPSEQLWLTHYQEHATELSRHLQTAVKSINTANRNTLNLQAVRATLIVALSLILNLKRILILYKRLTRPLRKLRKLVSYLYKIIINIRDPIIITSIKAINSYSLKVYIDYAIKESNNKYIYKLKLVSTN
ncbi:hypothetical protein LX36DRAFT_646727 [Colletotrichum falcatum]|nr:hypothetical protein LX36DRAFT_646727 [Colletotrichum falcatum]